MGLWALGTLVQSWVGDQLTQPTTPAAVQAVTAEWTVHGRLSVWARGQLAVTDHSGHLWCWLWDTLLAGARQLALPATPPRAPAAAAPPVREAA